MPDHFENNLGHIVFNNVDIATDYMVDAVNTTSNTIREWIANMHHEWNSAQRNVTYRDADVWDRSIFLSERPNWSEVFSPLEFDSSEDKNEDIEEKNELLDEFLNEFVVKGDDDK